MKDFSHVTIMFSLPRSATQWWAWMFGNAIKTLHDPLSSCRRPESLVKVLGPYKERTFIADTSAILFHDRIIAAMPGVQRIYNMRNPEDVMASLERETGLRNRKLVEQQNKLLFRHAFNGTQRRMYFGCNTPEAVAELWPKVTGMKVPDRNTLQFWRDHRVDVPVAQQYRNDANRQSLMGYVES